MSRTTLMLAVLLTLLPVTVASAASTTATALDATDVSLFQGRPDAGGRLLAELSASALQDGGAQAAAAKADFTILRVDGHAFAFALARFDGGVRVALPAAAAGASHGATPLADVAQALVGAVRGSETVVLLDTGEGDRTLTVGLFRPDQPDASLRAAGATRADVWIDGSDHAEALQGDGGLASLTVAGGEHDGQTLLRVVADLQAHAGAAAAGADGSGSGSDASGDVGAGAQLGGSAGDTDSDVDLNGTIGGSAGSSGGDAN